MEALRSKISGILELIIKGVQAKPKILIKEDV